MTVIRCEKCGEQLNQRKAVWLELSTTDGNYYATLPVGHASQGAFAFGSSCAKKMTKNPPIYKRKNS